jgi:hypothetical protein
MHVPVAPLKLVNQDLPREGRSFECAKGAAIEYSPTSTSPFPEARDFAVKETLHKPAAVIVV